MASRQSEAVTAMYRAWTEARRRPDPSRDEPLESNDHWGDLTAEPKGVDYLETDAGGIPAMWALPKGCAEDRVLLCFHGGGFISGSVYTHRKLFAHLAKATGVRALIAHYRLAPEHVFPSQLEDAVQAYRYLLDQRIRADRLAVAGDSSGGGLCVTMMLRARELAFPLPAAALLISPWVDMELSGASYETNRATDAFFHKEVVQDLVAAFLGANGRARDPLVNPLYADLRGVPPMYIQAGGDETLLDDARRLQTCARLAGVDTRLDVFAGQQHTFQMAAGRAPEADDAIQRFASWVRPKLGIPA